MNKTMSYQSLPQLVERKIFILEVLTSYKIIKIQLWRHHCWKYCHFQHLETWQKQLLEVVLPLPTFRGRRSR